MDLFHSFSFRLHTHSPEENDDKKLYSAAKNTKKKYNVNPPAHTHTHTKKGEKSHLENSFIWRNKHGYKK
jgi:hypothetical protein